MKYVGLHTQIARNNRKSLLLLLGFPTLILLGVFVFFAIALNGDMDESSTYFLQTVPWVSLAVLAWFLIAYFSHTTLIKLSTGARTLQRKENMRVYNLTENLCMSIGMTMPKLYVIDSPALNAFASGIDEKSYAVTLTTGIIEALDDRELEGVIAHELTHIRNRDVRLLIISIVFVGILGFVVEILLRSLIYGGGRSRKKNDKMDGRVILIALIVAAVVYFLTILFKFALSRKREYLADAGAVEMTRNPAGLASALRKISGNHEVDTKSDDVKQMFIENGPSKSSAFSGLSGLFSTHPPIAKRIQFLEQM